MKAHTAVPIEQYPRRASTPKSGKVLVCLGDSITQGQVSSNWVDRLASDFGPSGYTVVNAGVNGETAWNITQRLDAVIACDPDVVTLLIGTNDLQASNSATQEEYYRKRHGVPQPPSLGWYIQCVNTTLSRLRAETRATIILLDIPMIGENLDSELNDRVRTYNDALHVLAADHGVVCLPVHDSLTELLPAGHTPPPYSTRVGLIIGSTLRHGILRRSWDSISTRNGLAATTDHVHLNDRSSALIASLVSERIPR